RMLALLSVLLDRISGLLVLLALACVATLACPVPLPVWVQLAVGAAAAGAAVGLAVLPARTRLIARLDVGAGRGPTPLARLRNLAASLRHALAIYRRRPGLLVASTLLSVLVQAASVAQVALIGRAVGLDVPLAIYGIAATMVALLTLLPISLNGMG